MTITTVKAGAAKRRLCRLPRLAPLAAAMVGVLASGASRADWSVRPGVEVRETYTDNVALQPEASAEAQFVTEINSSVRLNHQGPRLTLSSTARLNYFTFADKEVSGTSRHYKQFSGNGRFEAVDDKVFIEASGFYGPRSVSPFGLQLTDNLYATTNRAQVSSWSVAPYLVERFGNSANLLVRYSRDKVDTGSSGFGASEGEGVLFNLSSGPAFNTLAWGVRLSRQDIDEKFIRPGTSPGTVGAPTSLGAEQNTSAQTALGSLRYRLSPTLSLTATAGYDKYDYSVLGGVSAGRSWSGGFIWTPTRRTSLDVALGKRFVGSSNSVLATHRSRRTVWRLSYSNSINNTRTSSLLPATFDTASLLDDMLLATIPDATQRRLRVEEVMREAALPPSLTDNISFLSSRYFLQKQLTGSAGIKLARTSAMMSIYRTRSDALTTNATDSLVLGNTLASLANNMRQEGASLLLTYAVSPRTSLRLTRNVAQTRSLVDDRTTFSRSLRLSATRKLARRLVAGAELRSIHGGTISTNSFPYRENAVAAYLTYQR